MHGVLRLMTAWMFVLPAPILAQAVAPQDVVGTWVNTSLEYPKEGHVVPTIVEIVLSFQADSTWTFHRRVDGVEIEPPKGAKGSWGMGVGGQRAAKYAASGHWALADDFLWLSEPTQAKPRQGAAYEIARQGEQLIVGEVNALCLDVFKRVDASKPLPPPVMPPLTVKRADLVGTWTTTGLRLMNHDEGADTLTLRADSTSTYRGREHIWTLLPGDILWLQSTREFSGKMIRENTGFFYKVAPQGTQLSFNSSSGTECDPPSAFAYQRMTP